MTYIFSPQTLVFLSQFGDKQETRAWWKEKVPQPVFAVVIWWLSCHNCICLFQTCIYAWFILVRSERGVLVRPDTFWGAGVGDIWVGYGVVGLGLVRLWRWWGGFYIMYKWIQNIALTLTLKMILRGIIWCKWFDNWCTSLNFITNAKLRIQLVIFPCACIIQWLFYMPVTGKRVWSHEIASSYREEHAPCTGIKLPRYRFSWELLRLIIIFVLKQCRPNRPCPF